MIKTETVTIGTTEFIHTYSDAGMMIHGGVPEADYSEAFDPADSGRTYTETDIPVEGQEDTAEDILNILMGEN